jgi:ubiquinone/menaquinone biosynthesis C-methylase UbiE
MDLDLLEIKGNEYVLDAGCGNGRHVWQVCKANKGTSVAFDLDMPSLSLAKYMLDQMDEKSETVGKWHMVCGSITNLPFENAQFDRVICSEVLEHIPDDHKAVSELLRVLKPGGILAVSVPSQFAESVCWKISDDYHNTPGGHIRIYKKEQIMDLLRGFNLDIYAVRYKHALHSIYWWSKGLFGLKNEKALIPSTYYKFLVWDIYTGHKYTKWLENGLNHIIPKSTAVYCRKPS